MNEYIDKYYIFLIIKVIQHFLSNCKLNALFSNVSKFFFQMHQKLPILKFISSNEFSG